MAFTKIITPGSQDFHEPVAQLIKFSSRGLHGNDLDAFIKRASVQFVDKIAGMRFGPGEEPVHLLAVGATETYGPNRNGDGFKKATCQQYHPTFVKLARWYRDHNNKDTRKGRGIIKASDYNPKMHRIELIVALNATKEAADRNRGLVADEEMEKLAKGEDIPVSMAARVSHDVCSGCGNHARTRKDYCGPETCTKYGGLRDNMAKTFEDGHILHADNPDPAFFDISKVFRNADRIAFTLGRAKAAADFHAACDDATAVPGEARGGAAIAERLGVSPPIWLLTDGPWSDPRIVGQLKIAQELIQMEDKLADSVPAALDRAFERSVQPVRGGLPEGPFKLAHVITALADARCMLPLPTFIAIMAGESTEKAAAIADAVAPRLAGVYNRLASDPRLEEDLRQNPYLPQNQAPRRLRHWALKYANEWSLDRPRVVERLQLSVLRQPRPNQRRQPMAKIATTAKTDEMAKEYALYQLGLLQHLASQPEADFRHELAIRSNFLQ